MSQLIALLTDFGTSDSFAGIMKGVILGIAPQTTVVDITHGIPPQDIRTGAYQLMTSCPYFPKDTFFVVVVDPGVGSGRKIVYAEAGGWRFLAPDNGILSWVFKETPPQKLINVSESEYFLKNVSATFHGRDIFSPVAAHLISGLKPEKLGPVIKDYVQLPFPAVSKGISKKGWKVEGEILAIDHFGNLITNLKLSDLRSDKVKIVIGNSGKSALGVYKTYTEVMKVSLKNNLIALTGSFGFIEISVPMGNAAAYCRAKISSKLRCYPL